jgi:glycosyltransferase involved in cell wall biosynthesis
MQKGQLEAAAFSPLESAPKAGLVSAIVPARNEEEVIAQCVQSLAQQPEISEILVVDDQSTDQTAAIVQNVAAAEPRVRLLQTQELPPGWLGKNNAVWTGAKEAKGDWLLFIDADAELLPGAVKRALEIAHEAGAGLVSFSPEQVTEAWYEKALIPFVYTRLARHFSYDAVNDPASPVTAANGQFLMIRSDIYQGMGGHASVAGNVLEDVAIAKLVKDGGQRIWFGPSAGLVRVRMYRSFDEMWEGWAKNLYLLVGGTRSAVYRELMSVVPWLSMLLILLGLKFPFALLLGVAWLLAAHAAYGSALLRNGFKLDFILYYVPAAVLYSGVLWASYRGHAHGRVTWKGREVTVGAARKSG